MTPFTDSDWHGLNECLKALYSPFELEQFPKAILTNIANLIPGDLFELVSFTADRSHPPRFYEYPAMDSDVIADNAVLELQGLVVDSLASRYLLTLDGHAVAVSELWSEVLLNRQETSYSEFLESTELQDQLAICFNLPPGLKLLSKVDPFHQGQEHLCLIISRKHQDFTERDRAALNLIRPHLQQAYERLVAFCQVHYYLAQQKLATGLVGLIALSSDSKIQWMSQRAEQILDRYFSSSSTPYMLPDILQQWISRHLSVLLQSEETHRLEQPFKLQMGQQRLSISLSYFPNLDQLYLSLEESTQESISVDSLQLLGLTKREAEVLFWIAKDRSLVELGDLLGISDRTAKKHLEHIYEKFGVQTRLSAVMYALEHLGILS